MNRKDRGSEQDSHADCTGSVEFIYIFLFEDCGGDEHSSAGGRFAQSAKNELAVPGEKQGGATAGRCRDSCVRV